ncbi:MAG: regulatory protein RecX [bacterium]|nr:regulatory protein RecX [bacterium]
MPSDHQKLLDYTFRILAKKRYTAYEMRKKMEQYLNRRHIVDEALIIGVLDRLLELKYLDDEQYTEDYVSTRIKLKPRGKFMLTKELKSKGISGEMLEKAFQKSPIDEDKIALQSLERKENQWNNLSHSQKKEKAFRFLATRGFNTDTIYKIVNERYNTVC